MTRKDFKIIAEILGKALAVGNARPEDYEAAIRKTSDILMGTNPRFKRDTFREAVLQEMGARQFFRNGVA